MDFPWYYINFHYTTTFSNISIIFSFSPLPFVLNLNRGIPYISIIWFSNKSLEACILHPASYLFCGIHIHNIWYSCVPHCFLFTVFFHIWLSIFYQFFIHLYIISNSYKKCIFLLYQKFLQLLFSYVWQHKITTFIKKGMWWLRYSICIFITF